MASHADPQLRIAKGWQVIDARSDGARFQANDQALDLIFRRARTYNAWLPDPVSPNDIQSIYALAKFGATSANSNPARFVWALTPAARDRVAACALDVNKARVRAAPAVVMIGYDIDFHQKFDTLMPFAPDKYRRAFADRREREETAFRNSSLQGAYLMIAARALGFDCGPMSGFDHTALNAEFFPESNLRANFICSIGRGDPASLMPRNPRFDFDEVNAIL